MIRMLSGCLCLCSAVFCCSLFHYTSVRCWCAVEQLTSLHSTLDLCFCFFRFDNLSSVSFFFASSRSWSFFFWNFLLVSLSCIAIAVSFDLVGPHVVMWLNEAHDHGSLKVGTWSKSVTTGISSWWSESTGLKANTLILISHILYTWLNVQSSIK